MKSNLKILVYCIGLPEKVCFRILKVNIFSFINCVLNKKQFWWQFHEEEYYMYINCAKQTSLTFCGLCLPLAGLIDAVNGVVGRQLQPEWYVW